MKFNVTTRVDGLREIRKRFEVIKRAPQLTLTKIGQFEVDAAKARIQTTKVDPDGNAWAAWSMATIKHRQREGSTSGGLLYRTGSLLSSIAYRVSNKTLTVFSNVGYARYLSQGTWKMPARKFLGWSQEGINRVKQTMKDAIK